MHFSPESLKPSIHTVCLEKQNRYSENALCFFLWMNYFVHIDVWFERVYNIVASKVYEMYTLKGNMMGGIKNPYLDASEWGWQIDPVGFKRALHELYDRYQLPLLVIENGLGAQDTLEADGTIHDPYRVDYMKRHIAAMKEAAEEGVDLMGYTMWSCIDLVSAGSGELRKRYGFVYVDAHDDGTGTFKRYRKDSFWWYKKVIESNGEDLG